MLWWKQSHLSTLAMGPPPSHLATSHSVLWSCVDFFSFRVCVHSMNSAVVFFPFAIGVGQDDPMSPALSRNLTQQRPGRMVISRGEASHVRGGCGNYPSIHALIFVLADISATIVPSKMTCDGPSQSPTRLAGGRCKLLN